MSFLEINDVSVSFPIKKGLLWPTVVDEVKAVQEVNLSIEKGEILGLVGESGCGKSTLSKVVMQLLKPTEGEIILEGQILSDLTGGMLKKSRLDFQMVFQDPYASLNPRYTVYSTLSEAVACRHPEWGKKERRVAVQSLMERVGIDPTWLYKYPHEFSGGQRQRIAIARALAPEPKLIIADEPVSALDVSIQSQILNLLKQLVKESELTMLFITHDLGVVRYMADNIAVMQQGRIVEYGEAETVFTQPMHAYTQTLLSSIPQWENFGS